MHTRPLSEHSGRTPSSLPVPWRQLRKWAGMLALYALTGCATPVDTTPVFNAHVAAFNQDQPHVVHQVARADGLHIVVREFGLAANKAGPTLVLMHGFPDNQHLYDLLIAKLSSRHHVLSFDFLGWGDSDKPPLHRYDVASQRADLDAVVRYFNLQSVLLVVHDLSGQAGIDWALDNEPHTAGLVLLNTYYHDMPTLKAPQAIAFYSTPSLWRDLATWGAKKSGERFKTGVGSQMRKFFSNPTRRDAFVPVLTHTAADIRPAFFSATLVLWEEVAARQNKVARLRAFDKPVWVIFGADDPDLNVGVAQEFHRLFKRSSLHLVQGAGHYVQLDQPEQVDSILRLGLAAN
jgi:haloalkane dehalogenase